MNLLHLLRPAPEDFAAYYARLTEADALRGHEYPVFSSARTSVSGKNILISWIETIEAAAGLFQEGQDWGDLTEEEIAILLGLRHAGKDWGLLGNMALAGSAIRTFKRRPDVRKYIRHQLGFVLRAKNVGLVAANVIGSISALSGFGPAIASRLITLARPEFGISVNNGSAPGLAELLGWRDDPLTLTTQKNYPALLEWISEQPWNNSSEPKQRELHRVWKTRAALIDVFVYEPPQ